MFRKSFLILFFGSLAIFAERELTLLKEDMAVIDSRAHDRIDASKIIIEDESLNQYLKQVVLKLHNNDYQQAENFSIKVYSSAALNAFSKSDGTIYICLPILGMIDNEAQLAFLLAHEMTHWSQNHHMEMKYELHTQALKAAQSQIAGSIFGVSGAGSQSAQIALSGFSKKHEHEADSIALAMVSLSGYNPWAAKEFFMTMYTWLKHKEKKRVAKYATHPKLMKRYKACKNRIINNNTDTTSGEIGKDSYHSVLQPYHIKIAELLLQSNSVYELHAMAIQKSNTDYTSPKWRYLRGKLLEVYFAKDSFSVARKELHSAAHDTFPIVQSFRDLGWLYLKNGKTDSASLYFNEYLQANQSAKDAELIRYYLGQM